MTRILKFSEAIREATDQCLENDPRAYVIGLGVPDPKGIFGTTLGLQEKYGGKRVLDMPTSENGMTGIAIGSAIVGLRPIMTHQRVDFALLAMDQIINNAAKWHYMFDRQMSVPLVIRLIIGRGWGQGPQHSQSLHSLFAHIPGLKVVMPSTPYDAKGLLIAAVEDNNPVIYMEHRWLHGVSGHVPQEMYRITIGQAKRLREGGDVTIVSTSFMSLEALHAAKILEEQGIHAEVIDVRSLMPLDEASILQSVRKTGRLIVADADWKTLGFGAEVLALVSEEMGTELKCNPIRIAFPDHPVPTTWYLANRFYPNFYHIVSAAKKMLGIEGAEKEFSETGFDKPHDVPDESFKGPF